jgi:hypothetical protein
MADFPSFDRAAREDIARQIARRFADQLPPRVPATLLEAIPIDRLDLQKLNISGQRLRDALVRSDRWHHQIRLGARKFGFARAVAHEERWLIVELALGAFATRVARTIAYLDEARVSEGAASLLLVPEQGVAAIAIVTHDTDLVSVIDRPARLRKLPTCRPVDGQVFLSCLTQFPNRGAMPAGSLQSG